MKKISRIRYPRKRTTTKPILRINMEASANFADASIFSPNFKLL